MVLVPPLISVPSTPALKLFMVTGTWLPFVLVIRAILSYAPPFTLTKRPNISLYFGC